ncbi:MAG: DUF4405 domain-containing protein [Candidatus Pacearchaeota archaeon]|jgi:hypothetical protein
MKKLILLLLLLGIIPFISSLDCPIGLINDTYPGNCGLYTDANNNQICDHSENQIIQDANSEELESKNFAISPNGKQYYLLWILPSLIVIYLISYFLSKKQKILMITHKKIWNLLLFITFLGVGISGLFLVIKIQYNINITWPFNLLFWHVETGIVMVIISIFHILWHWAYFKTCIK